MPDKKPKTEIFYFCRSAEATKVVMDEANPRESDLRRLLSLDGLLEQAPARQKDIRGVEFCAVFSSPARRAVQTAGIIAGKSDSITQIDELYMPAGSLGNLFDAMYAEHKNAPLETYLEDPRNNGCLENFGESAYGTIRRIIRSKPRNQEGIYGIFGHAPSLQATMLAMLKPDQQEFRDLVRKLVLPHVGMVAVMLTDGVVTNIEVMDSLPEI